MSCLIGKGADVNIKNHYGRTIIHQLALEGNEQMFSLFLSQPGIDLSIPDDTGKSLIHTVCEWGRLPFLKELVNVPLPFFPPFLLSFLFPFPFPFPLPSHPPFPFLSLPSLSLPDLSLPNPSILSSKFFLYFHSPSFPLPFSYFLSSVLYSSISADLFPSHYPALPPLFFNFPLELHSTEIIIININFFYYYYLFTYLIDSRIK